MVTGKWIWHKVGGHILEPTNMKASDLTYATYMLHIWTRKGIRE